MEKKVFATQLRTSEKTIEELDKFAGKMGLSRNQLMNNLLRIGLEDLTVLDRLGIVRVGVGIRTMFEKLRPADEEALMQQRLFE